jgi:hypothetical protein
MDGDDGFEGTSPIMAFKQPSSSAIASDLEGNLSEWVVPEAGQTFALGSSFATSTPAGTEPEKRVVEGGMASETIGFRCATDP